MEMIYPDIISTKIAIPMLRERKKKKRQITKQATMQIQHRSKRADCFPWNHPPAWIQISIPLLLRFSIQLWEPLIGWSLWIPV